VNALAGVLIAERGAAGHLFAPFVGSWELDVFDHHDDGSVESARGEWHWGWILEGRAIQDVWITPPRAEGSAVEYGTAVRLYDGRVVWSGPVRGRQIMFVARLVDGEIVLAGEEHGAPLRWIFSEIRPGSFRWRAESAGRLVQEMDVRRV
jgi:hypothetical protein